METKELTLKQRKWIHAYIETGNATDAAIIAYDCKGNRETAAQIGWENMRKLDYSDFLEAAGITDNLLQKKILEGLDATKTVSAKIIGKDADSQTDDFIDVPDFMARHKYLETALKLKKRMDTDKGATFEAKILVVPSELIEKYDKQTTPGTGDSSKR